LFKYNRAFLMRFQLNFKKNVYFFKKTHN
jgi:hypothetical protein